MEVKKKLRFVELFAGCGGMTLGLTQAGFNPVFANELSPMAAETYAHNLLKDEIQDMFWLSSQFSRKEHDRRLRENPNDAINGIENDIDKFLEILGKRHSLLVGSITQLVEILQDDNKKLSRFKEALGQIDLVSGGPPCQSYSLIGRREKDNRRNRLFEDFASLVEIIEPKLVLFENVSGILHPFKGEDGNQYHAWFEVAKKFASIGYIPLCFHVNTKYLGIPQNRPRFLMLAIRYNLVEKLLVGSKKKLYENLFTNAMDFYQQVTRGNLNFKIEYKQKLLRNYTSPNGDIDRIQRFIPSYDHANICSVSDAIDDISKNKATNNLKLKNHDPRRHSPTVRARFRLMQEVSRCRFTYNLFKKWCRYPEVDPPMELVKYLIGKDIYFPWDTKQKLRKPKNILEIKRLLYKVTTKKHSQRVLRKDEPAPAQLSIPDDMCHYSKRHPRTLTVREMARIQTFPDWFEFCSKVTTGGKMRSFEVPQYTQVGNAVPPRLALKVGERLKELLDDLGEK